MATEPKVKPKPQKSSRPTPCREETIMDLIMNFTFDEAGASAVEYALLMAFIAVAIAASVSIFGIALRDSFRTSKEKMFSR
jgi:Flp pilus assembly pilin Flp